MQETEAVCDCILERRECERTGKLWLYEVFRVCAVASFGGVQSVAIPFVVVQSFLSKFSN